MEHSPDKLCDEQHKAVRYLKLTGAWSEAFSHDPEWVRSRIADLKIDLYLATEQGSTEHLGQIEEIEGKIDILETTLKPSLFDPAPENAHELALQSAAADLAQYALWIAFQETPKLRTEWQSIKSHALEFLETMEARSMGYSCLQRVLDQPGIIFEDGIDLSRRAKSLLLTYIG